jgi:hypothetical protein
VSARALDAVAPGASIAIAGNKIARRKHTMMATIRETVENPDGNPQHNCRAAVRKNEIRDVDGEYDQQREQKKTTHGLGGAENVLIGHGDSSHYRQATNGHDGNSVSRRATTLAQTD